MGRSKIPSRSIGHIEVLLTGSQPTKNHKVFQVLVAGVPGVSLKGKPWNPEVSQDIYCLQMKPSEVETLIIPERECSLRKGTRVMNV